MKRILHIVGGMGLGGTETFLMNIYRNLNREEVQFDFVIYKGNEHKSHYEEEIKILGGKILLLPNPSIKKPFITILRLKKILVDNQYIAVHTHTKFNSGFALIAAWLCRVKIRVAHSHNTGGGNQISALEKIYQKVMYWSINVFATSYSACSKKAAEHLFTNTNIKKHYRFIPNAVDFKSFFETSLEGAKQLKSSFGILENRKIIGHVGRFGKAKNHEFIVKMFAQLLQKDSSFCLILIGDGPSRANVEETIKLLGITESVKVLGQRNDVPQLMNMMDLFILPSNYEGLGIVLLEAQTAGLPCVVSENIQPEADMDMGLMHWVNLNNMPLWIDTIIANKESKIYEKDQIRNIIMKSSYVLSSVVNKFYELYGLDELKSN